ncbi:hypothetical protein AC482_05545 [miscellaneous Crenarchaeota group-15 archaeon DG-45]|uniref:Major facilitator superfamily (MFS) profile domain-containing protein n=1 Tax=miscellaneous Crenarchaeota group-15 archaeon DG-45 TaxID=1685127 RepID=A0A0M0BMK5_9ARCH|nr:MAG: hypothetical protein AC482_05545 [miscellaneous Crenarchaeota group-15 archaeon DG-45]
MSMPRIYFELILIGFIIMAGMSLPSSFLPILADSLDPSGLLVGLVVSAWFLSRIFLEIPAGIISDRLGRRRLLIFGIGLSVMGPLLCAVAGNIYLLIIGRAVWGLGTAFYFMNNMALLIDLFPSRTRGRALGVFQGIEFIGSFIGAPIGAYLAVYMSYNQVFYVTLALTVTSLLIALTSRSMKMAEPSSAPRPKPPLRDVLSSLRDWSIAAVCVCNLFRMFIRQGIFQTVLQLYLKRYLMFPLEHIGIVLSLSIAGQVISVLAAGVLSDRFGRKPVLITGYVTSVATLYAFTVIKGLNLMLLVSFLSGLGEGFSLTTLMALFSDIMPSSVRGGAIGLYRTFQDVGGVVGPVALMLVYTAFSGVYPFYLAILFEIINIALVTILRA